MEHDDMEQVIEQLKRIATALEDANLLNEEWIKRNREWRQENVEKGERDLSAHLDWLAWQKQQKREEREQVEQWCDAGVEKMLAARKEQDELLLALQREILTGEKHDDD